MCRRQWAHFGEPASSRQDGGQRGLELVGQGVEYSSAEHFSFRRSGGLAGSLEYMRSFHHHRGQGSQRRSGQFDVAQALKTNCAGRPAPARQDPDSDPKSLVLGFPLQNVCRPRLLIEMALRFPFKEKLRRAGVKEAHGP